MLGSLVSPGHQAPAGQAGRDTQVNTDSAPAGQAGRAARASDGLSGVCLIKSIFLWLVGGIPVLGGTHGQILDFGFGAEQEKVTKWD